MPAQSGAVALAYQEPSIVVILTQSSFLLLLNIAEWAIDASLHCGLIGQILVGVAWGTPAEGRLLSADVEAVIVQLGYLGLILIVFEGGLSTSFPALKANIWLSVAVAATGISVPIGLSFVLSPLLGASKLQCFAAGAALCSTSLGTTFAVLRSSGLTATRLGVVLTSAAMLDDVVGLVMVQVISNIGGSGAPSISAATVLRPVLVSLAFVIGAVVLCRLVVQPLSIFSSSWLASPGDGWARKLLCRRGTAFTLHTALLVALVAGSSYAGTSNLFAAYIAGAMISWWDSEVPHPRLEENSASATEGTGEGNIASAVGNESSGEGDSVSSHRAARHVGRGTSGSDIYDYYYGPAVKKVLQPFFFASIGFSIPITQMFSGPVLWRGIIYASLMLFGKLACGLWLVRLPSLTTWVKNKWLKKRTEQEHRAPPPPGNNDELLASARAGDEIRPSDPSDQHLKQDGAHVSTDTEDIALSSRAEPSPSTSKLPGSPKEHKTVEPAAQPLESSASRSQNTTPGPQKPISLYPAAILGLALVARGEIGFLISSVAQSDGVLGGGQPGGAVPEIFLVVTWAIVLCTIIGPLCVGLLVRRVRSLERKTASMGRAREQEEGEASFRNVLGVWGVR